MTKTVQEIAEAAAAALASAASEVASEVRFTEAMAAKLAGTKSEQSYRQASDQLRARGVELAEEAAAAAAVADDERAKVEHVPDERPNNDAVREEP